MYDDNMSVCHSVFRILLIIHTLRRFCPVSSEWYDGFPKNVKHVPIFINSEQLAITINPGI